MITEQPSRERDPVFNLGDEACVTTKSGQQHSVIIRWKGVVDSAIHPRRPFMYGIEYKGPIGKHNGRGLFHCKADHGSLVLPKSLSVINQVGNLPKRRRRSNSLSSRPVSRRGSISSSASATQLGSSDQSSNQSSNQSSVKSVIKQPLKPVDATKKAKPAQRAATKPVGPVRAQIGNKEKTLRLRQPTKPTTTAKPAVAPRGRTPSRPPAKTPHRGSSTPVKAPPRRSRSVPSIITTEAPTKHRMETPKKVHNTENLENEMSNMNLSRSVKRNVYPTSKFTPDLKYKPVVSGVPVRRNTPAKQIFRSRSRDPLAPIK